MLFLLYETMAFGIKETVHPQMLSLANFCQSRHNSMVATTDADSSSLLLCLPFHQTRTSRKTRDAVTPPGVTVEGAKEGVRCGGRGMPGRSL